MNSDLLSIAALAFVLGIRHGLDADHLACIDAITRHNSLSKPALSRYCGVLFSLGHGIVVLLIAAFVGSAAVSLYVPGWVADCGSIISISCLILLGVVNILALIHVPEDEPVQLIGIKTGALGSLQKVGSPLAVMVVGLLFAISFDTISQAALFAVLGSKYGGLSNALILGALFVFGMLLVDGINGFWISRVFAGANQMANRASRIMALLVGLFSLSIAGLGIAKCFCGDIELLSERYQLQLGLSLVAIAFISALFMPVLTRRVKL